MSPWEISGHAEEGKSVAQERLEPQEDTDVWHKVVMTGFHLCKMISYNLSQPYLLLFLLLSEHS